MSVTLAKLAYDISNIASSGVAPDDFRISLHQIEYWIHECRSTLISQAIQKRQDFSDVWIQRIHDTPLSLVDKAECADIDIDCDILRTDVKIPRTVEVDNNNLIISVTGLDGEPIHKLNYFRSKYKSYSKYTGSTKGWFLRGDYIYVINDTDLKRITINAIFEDPSELATFYCTGVAAWTVDSDYPVSLKMAQAITDIVIKTKVAPLLQFPTDSKNDGSNTPSVIEK